MRATAADYSVFIGHDAAGHAQMNLVVEGIERDGSIEEIERGLASLPGVMRARLNYTNHRLNVAWDAAAAPDAVMERLESLGYRAHPYAPPALDAEAQQGKWLLRCLGVAGFAAMNVMLLSVSVWAGNVSDITPETRDLFHWVSALIALPAAAYAGQPFFLSALQGLRTRRLNMDVPISLGVILALGMSLVETALHREHAYFDSALMLLFFLLAGRYLDHAARQRTRSVAANVSALRGEMAFRLAPDGQPVLVPVQALAAGDVLLVPPGERIGADGTIEDGQSSISEALVTGETPAAPRNRRGSGPCRQPERRRRAEGARHRRRRPDAGGRGAAAARCRHDLARGLCAPRRPGRPRLCARGACHRAGGRELLGRHGPRAA